MRRGIATVVAVLLVPAAALAAIKPGTTSRLSGPSFGTSGGDEPYVVSFDPLPGGGAVVGWLTRLNLSDTPPGDFILRPVDAAGVPSGPPVTFGKRDDIHVAAAALDAAGDEGLAIWDDHPDGEDEDAGPIWVQRFAARTAAPIGAARKILDRTELYDMVRLGEGYLMLHERFRGPDPVLQQLDATGALSGEEVPLGFYSPELAPSADGESALAFERFSGGRAKAAVIGRDRFLFDPARIEIRGNRLIDVEPAPKGGWLLLVRTGKGRLQLQSFSEAGELGEPLPVAAATSAAGAELAFEGQRGLLVWGHPKPCAGFSAVALKASGRPASAKATAVPAAPACGVNAIYDLELSASGPRRFVLGWSSSNGDAGHYVYTTGIRR